MVPDVESLSPSSPDRCDPAGSSYAKPSAASSSRRQRSKAGVRAVMAGPLPIQARNRSALLRPTVDLHSPELAGIIATNPTLLWSTLETLDDWTPAVQSVSNGKGNGVIITDEMITDANDLVEGIKAKASPGLQAAIQKEQDAVNLPGYAGLTMDQAWERLKQRQISLDLLVPLVLR